MKEAPPGYNVKLMLDSIAPSGVRLTTWELTYPRFVHSELLTHRLLSRNSASSRAIPGEKMLARIEETPALPIFWGKNQSGMQAAEELTGEELAKVRAHWDAARYDAVAHARNLHKLGLHKQLANRITEPWMYITAIVSATELENWDGLRNHPDAQPEIAWVAGRMSEIAAESEPRELKEGEWHLPYIKPEDREQITDELELCRVATGRCARVSYLTHDGRRDLSEDLALTSKLGVNGHWSPFEHCAKAMTVESWNQRVEALFAQCKEAGQLFDASLLGNFSGWLQYRKTHTPETEQRRKFAWGAASNG